MRAALKLQQRMLYPSAPVIPDEARERAKTGLYSFFDAKNNFVRRNVSVEWVRYRIGHDGGFFVPREVDVIGYTPEGTVSIYPSNGVAIVSLVEKPPTRRQPRIAVTQRGRDVIAGILYRETGGDVEALEKGEYLRGLAGVFNTMETRYWSYRWNPQRAPIDVVAQRIGQYAEPASNVPSPVADVIYEIVDLGLEGLLDDVVGGADSFYAPRLGAYLSGTKTVKIGGHQFLKQRL